MRAQPARLGVGTGHTVTLLTLLMTWAALLAAVPVEAQDVNSTREGSRRIDQAPAGQTRPDLPTPRRSRPSGALQQEIAPGLATLTDDVLYGDVWRRTELSPRDRSLVTVAALIAAGKTAQLAGHLGRALDNGVHAREASAALAHLAIYCGWPSVVSALEIYRQVYTQRNVDTSALGVVGPPLPAPSTETTHARPLSDQIATVAPKFAELTHDVVFDDLWRRSDLTLRDRSLITIAALVAMGHGGDQLDFYLRLGVENGLARSQIAETITHLAFYVGWPRATNALTAVARTLSQAQPDDR